MAITGIVLKDNQVKYSTFNETSGWHNRGVLGKYIESYHIVTYVQYGAAPVLFNDLTEFAAHLEARYGVKPTFEDANK